MSEIFEALLHYCCRTVGMLVLWSLSLGKVTDMGRPKRKRKTVMFTRAKDGWIVHEDMAALVGLLVLVGGVLIVILTKAPPSP